MRRRPQCTGSNPGAPISLPRAPNTARARLALRAPVVGTRAHELRAREMRRHDPDRELAAALQAVERDPLDVVPPLAQATLAVYVGHDPHHARVIGVVQLEAECRRPQARAAARSAAASAARAA